MNAEQWLQGVAVEQSSTMFLLGDGQAQVREVLDRRGWRGTLIAIEPPRFDVPDSLSSTLEPDSENPVVVLNPAAIRADRERVKHAARSIARAWFGARANQEARSQNAGRYLFNTLRNVPAIAKEGDAAGLTALFSRVPAMVVAAGPSLDRNIPEIKVRDRTIIIAADTALRPLLSAGIEPDLVVGLDPTETNARHLSDLPPCARTFLVAEGSLDAEALPHFAGRTLFFQVSDHHPWPWLSESGLRRGRLRAWGSVLTTAFDLALVMQCDPIVFAGADLAFTGGQPYARGTTFEEVWRRSELWGDSIEQQWRLTLDARAEVIEKDVNGLDARTAPHLRAFRDWIAGEAAKVSGTSVFNATGGGILLGPGICQASFKDVLEKMPSRDATIAGAQITLARAATCTAIVPIPSEAPAATQEQWRRFVGTRPTAAPAPVEVTAGVTLVCNEGGPALLAEIESAWSRVNEGERLTLLDRTGAKTGHLVRKALFAFLATHPGVTAHFGRWHDPDSQMSWIHRGILEPAAPLPRLDKNSVEHGVIADRLAPLIVEQLKPSSVLDVGSGAGHWLRALRSLGVDDGEGIALCDAPTFEASRHFDLCLCLGIVQQLPHEVAEAVVARCAAASDTILFAAPAAAGGVQGFINDKPWSVWHRLFWKHGFAPFDEFRPLVFDKFGDITSHCDVAMVYRRVEVDARMLDAADRNDDQFLEAFWLRRKLSAAIAPPGPPMQAERLVITRSRMLAGEGEGVRAFQFRTTAGLLALGDKPSLAVEEDARPLAGVAFDRDGFSFRASDNTDPRHNGREYTVTVPTHVKFLEELPLATILEKRL